MRRPSSPPLALLAPIAAALLVCTGCRAAESRTGPQVTIAVVDFEYRDTSGEERDQRGEHEARVRDFMAALKSDLAARGKAVISLPCAPAPCAASMSAADLLRLARDAGAGVLLVGSIQKMSTLIQWAKAEVIDTATERMVLDKLFTFRGDTDESWRRAEAFIAGELAAMAPPDAR